MTHSPTPARRNLFSAITLGLCAAVLAGCEGIDRKHDQRVADITPPKVGSEPLPGDRPAPDHVNYADLVEQMLDQRKAYLDSIMAVEKAYLAGGDSDRANWARSQRAQVEKIENYPYLSNTTAEYTPDASPVEQNVEADKLYAKGLSILNTFRRIPAAGMLAANKKKAREALVLFKRVLAEYPRSDKVDDAAFWCGEIYKEYLREEDPNDELSVRYYQWAYSLDPQTPHPARFQCAVVYDFRKHDRARAIELYHEVLDKETFIASNARFSATRVEQLTDEEHSHVRPRDKDVRDTASEPPPADIDETAPPRESATDQPTVTKAAAPAPRSTSGTRRTSARPAPRNAAESDKAPAADTGTLQPDTGTLQPEEDQPNIEFH